VRRRAVSWAVAGAPDPARPRGAGCRAGVRDDRPPGRGGRGPRPGPGEPGSTRTRAGSRSASRRRWPASARRPPGRSRRSRRPAGCWTGCGRSGGLTTPRGSGWSPGSRG